MKYVDEFRDPRKAHALSKEIRKLVARIERAKQWTNSTVSGNSCWTS